MIRMVDYFFRILFTGIVLFSFWHFVVPVFHQYFRSGKVAADFDEHVFDGFNNALDDFYQDIGNKGIKIIVLIIFIIIFFIFAIFCVVVLVPLYYSEYIYFLSVVLSGASALIAWRWIYPIFPRLCYYSLVGIGLHMEKKKRGGDLMVSDNNDDRDMGGYVRVPLTFDEAQIDYGFKKYRRDGRLLSAYIKGLVERFRADEQIKIIRKKIELLGLAKQYLELFNQVADLRTEIELLDRKRENKIRELEKTTKELDHKGRLLDKKAKAEEAKYDWQTELYRQKREDLTQPKRSEDNEIEKAIKRLKQEIISEEEAKREISLHFYNKGYTEEQVDAILDRFDQKLVEHGLKEEGRY